MSCNWLVLRLAMRDWISTALAALYWLRSVLMRVLLRLDPPVPVLVPACTTKGAVALP
ncbi:hypothetical protein D3C87_2007520 [compost metagenome]